MVSMSAVRIVFVSGGFNHLKQSGPNRKIEMNSRNRLPRDDVMNLDLPTVPSATLAGATLSS